MIRVLLIDNAAMMQAARRSGQHRAEDWRAISDWNSLNSRNAYGADWKVTTFAEILAIADQFTHRGGK